MGAGASSDKLDHNELLARLNEAEETLRAIRTGAVDAVVVSGRSGSEVDTRQGADHTYRMLVQEMGEGALCMTGQGLILHANPAFCRLVDLPEPSVPGRSLYEFVDRDERTIFEDLIRSAPARRETRLLTAEKSIPVLVDVCRFEWDGVPVYGAVITDLRGQKVYAGLLASQTALRESEQLLRQAMESGDAGSWQVNLATGAFVASDRALELHGLPAGTPATHDQALSCVHPDDRATVASALWRTFETGESFRLEHRIASADGTLRWVFSFGERRGADGQTTIVGLVQDITERKMAEQQLRASNEAFRRLIEDSPFGVYAVDADFRLVLVSAGAQKVFENVRPLIGRDFAEILRIIWPEPFASEAVSTFRHTLETGDPYHAPSTVERRGDIDEVEAYDWKIERVTLPDGRYGVVCHFYDLSERQRFEAALREHSELLRTVLESTTDLIWVKDTQGRITLGNEATFALLGGGDKSRVLGGGARELIPDPEHAARVMENDSRVMQTGHAEIVEEYFGPSEDPKIFQSVKAPLRDAAGNIVGVVGVSRDVTEDRRLALQLQVYAGRQAFLVRLNDILRTLSDAEAIKAEASRLLGERLQAGRVGYAECQGDECTVRLHYSAGLGGIAGHYRLNDYGPLLSNLAAGRPIVKPDVANDSSLSVEQRDAYSALAVAAMVVMPLVRRGKLVSILFVHHASPHSYSAEDLTLIQEVAERTWAAVERGRAEEALRAANRDLEQFAYSASHDLKEPLRNLAIYTQLLAQRYQGKLDPQADQFLHFIIEGAHRMGLLISDLSSFIQSTHLDEQPRGLVAGDQVLQGVLESLHQAIQESGAVLTYDSLPVIPVKELHFQQLLQNLIGNSLKYRKETEAPRIHISALPEGGQWRFSVRDNGIGIAPEFHGTVFGLFKRLHARTSKYEGTGIGLAICQKIMERYGGRIWLESESGQGAVFHFTLPSSGGRSSP